MIRVASRVLGVLSTLVWLAAPRGIGPRELRFEDRVDAERALARVRYAHEIAPARSFDETYPPAVLESAVRRTDDLSQRLALEWATPVTAQMLRAEVLRMARTTRMPARLRELFAALHDDPVLVEECLARPVLVERLSRNFAAAAGRTSPPAGRIPGRSRPRLADGDGEDPARAGGARFETVATGLALPSVPDRRVRSLVADVAGEPAACTFDDAWDHGALDEPPDPRAQHTAVWTGTTMLVWGGNPISGSGAQYDPATDTWSSISSSGAPSPRYGHSAVWTGSRMIVWGGTNGAAYLADGASYDPATDVWSPLSNLNAPSARSGHTAVWTGTRMLVWGGSGASSVLSSGASYDPATGDWTPLPAAGAPAARTGHSAVWTGTRMVVFGGTNGPAYLASGSRYDPLSNSWSPIAPLASGRAWHSAVWTGSVMVVWGGFDGTNALNTGSRYDPSANTWQSTSASGFAPSRRLRHAAVWSGSEMLIWGGVDAAGALPSQGGQYNPVSDNWTVIQTAAAPAPRQLPSAVWTGDALLLWGGRTEAGAVRSGGRYDPFASQWTPISTGSAPAPRSRHSAVWTGNLWIVWGGDDGHAPLATGGAYDPAVDAWTPTSQTNAPAAREDHSAVWTGAAMVVWGGKDADGYFRDGGRYDPIADQWSAVTTEDSPPPRASHGAVWSGTRMLVWGGEGDTGALAGGARYDPVQDAWSPLSSDGQPTARKDHVMVWTGTRMLVWGGGDGTTFRDDGGRYDPESDAWSQISAVNAPSARSEAPSLFTGRYMFVWGGYDGRGELATGALYDAVTNSWAPTSAANAPIARRGHSAVWNDRYVLVFGGNGAAGRNGARYDPYLDQWIALDENEAPVGRQGHSALWTGSRMLVWGGAASVPVATGGIYDPGVAVGDVDQDGVCGASDNCPLAYNPSQRDGDGDALGDACDPERIDFAPAASSVAPGYLKDDGSLYTPARGYGWDAALLARERTTAAPLELDTFVFTAPERRFTWELPDGNWVIGVSVGDAQFPQGPQRVVIQGETALNGVNTTPSGFVQASLPVEVRGGRTELLAGGAGGNTCVDWVAAYRAEDQPGIQIAVSFAPGSAASPAGFRRDRGLVFDAGRGYGWNAAVATRERGAAVPRLFDSFAFTSVARTWELAVPDGTYHLRLGVGDASYAQGPQRIVAEGTTVIDDASTAAGTFLERDATVKVTDGRLTLQVGGGGGNTTINYVSVWSAGP